MENLKLAKRIRAFRKLKGYTQADFAARAGISLAMLGAIERGNRRIEEPMLEKIADSLGITVTEFKQND